MVGVCTPLCLAPTQVRGPCERQSRHTVVYLKRRSEREMLGGRPRAGQSRRATSPRAARTSAVEPDGFLVLDGENGRSSNLEADGPP